MNIMLKNTFCFFRNNELFDNFAIKHTVSVPQVAIMGLKDLIIESLMD